MQTTKPALEIANVTIRGIRPLLMSSPKEMFATAKMKRLIEHKIGKDIDPVFEAERRAYRNKNDGWSGDLCVPATCVLGNIYTATKLFEAQTTQGKKTRGLSLQSKVKGSVYVEPDNIPLLDHKGKQVKEFEVNASKVRIKATGGSIVRYRPVIKDWQLSFQIKWNSALYGLTSGSLKSIIEAGGAIGLLDWRPTFGIYETVGFEVIEA